MATLKEIAEKAGVSIGTVDRVLHNRGKVAKDKEELIRRIMEELEYKPNVAGQGLAILRKKLQLVFICVDVKGHPFFEDVIAGAKVKAKELEQYGIETKFLTMSFYEEINVEDYTEADGIATIGILSDQVVKWANEKNIPIVCYNIPIDSGEYLAYVGCDYVKAGKIAGGLCAMVTNKKGKVAILTEGTEEVLSYRQRVLGFQRELEEKYPQMELSGIYMQEGEESFAAATYRMLWEQPDLDVVYLINPGDYSVCRIIREAAKNPNIKIITNDLTGNQKKLVEEEIITATICQEPERQGSQALEILFQYLGNHISPKEKYIYTDLSIHISQNI